MFSWICTPSCVKFVSLILLRSQFVCGTSFSFGDGAVVACYQRISLSGIHSDRAVLRPPWIFCAIPRERRTVMVSTRECLFCRRLPCSDLRSFLSVSIAQVYFHGKAGAEMETATPQGMNRR